jgi:predicted ester cyclase
VPDFRFAVDDWFQAGTRYVLRMHAKGGHNGVLPTPLGLAQPTGREVGVHGIEVFEVVDDRVVGVSVVWNYGELYECLGATLPDNG